jgi:hypothetical protein
MTDDNLRLRTARALGHNVLMGSVYGHPIIACMVNGALRAREVPPYGTTWASCEEIDAEIRRRGWNYSVRVQAVSIAVHGPLCVVRIEVPPRGGARKRMRCISERQAATFPAALAEAFCQAVERQTP